MAEPRTLRITIVVEDDGGPDAYERILSTLRSIGAEIEDEETIA